MAEKEDHPVSELRECIDQVMPLALQTILDKSEAPIFKNILHVIATYGHEWFLHLTAAGKFVQLSTGWTYVRRTNTVISDHSDMDEAVLDAIRHLSSAGKGAKLAEICNYIIAAFRFPEVLSPEGITEKIQCSANLMKVWGRVVVDKGCYRLSEEPLTGNEAKKAAVTTPLTSLSSKVDAKHEPEVEPQLTNCIFPESKEKNLPVRTETGLPEKTDIDNDSKPDQRPDESHVSPKSFEYAAEKINTVLHADQVSIISSTEAHQPPVSPLSTPRGPDTSTAEGSMQVIKPSFGAPFQYASGCYKLFVVFTSRIRPKVKLNVKDQVQVTFKQNKLRFCQIIVTPRKSHMAFVEVEKIEDGLEAIEMLHQSFQCKGVYQLTVEWAHPNGKDFADLKFAKWEKWQRTARRRSGSRDSRRRRSSSSSSGSTGSSSTCRSRSPSKSSRSPLRSTTRPHKRSARPVCRRSKRSRSRSRSSKNRRSRKSSASSRS